MRYLVTGGAGFIGSNFVRSLIGNGGSDGEVRSVTILDSFTYAASPATTVDLERDRRVRVVEGDVNDATIVKNLVDESDIVVHFAAESHVDRSIVGSAEFIRTNIAGTHVLLEACRRVGGLTFIYVSTDEVYGSISAGSWTERSPLAPNSPYAASKAAGDLLARSFFVTYGLDVRITRCSNNFGFFQHPEKVIPRFITNLIDGLPVPVYGTGKNVREWLHVADHCDAIHRVIASGSPGSIYNVGSGTELTNLDLARMILHKFGFDDSMITWVADRPGHDLRYSVDTTSIRADLGFFPSRQFHSHIDEVITWYRENEDWWRPLVTR